ncbi:MAG: type II toxin-antitoxin system mRNA interferase toxin, RelE/StbE family [Syntrophomonadaceae bacterium]|nr:type II toxin-antitoxin system mRNA interferase toxin, RelE/StbE family [Syntrophomonadaceae bacterium]
MALQTLIEQKPLEEKHRDHPLTGKYIRFRECHIQPYRLLSGLVPELIV